MFRMGLLAMTSYKFVRDMARLDVIAWHASVPQAQ